jgi:hypothetical protein
MTLAAVSRKDAVKRGRRATEIGSVLFHASRLKRELHATLHNCKRKSVDEVAWTLRVSPSYLYRSCLPNENGCRFPADLLPALMAETRDYRVLEFLARETDHVLVRNEKVRQLRTRDASTLNAVQASFHAAMGTLLSFWNSPQTSDKDALLAALHQVASDIEAIRRAVRDFDQAQGALF